MVTSFDGAPLREYPDYASWFNANETVNGLGLLSTSEMLEGGLPGVARV